MFIGLFCWPMDETEPSLRRRSMAADVQFLLNIYHGPLFFETLLIGSCSCIIWNWSSNLDSRLESPWRFLLRKYFCSLWLCFITQPPLWWKRELCCSPTWWPSFQMVSTKSSPFLICCLLEVTNHVVNLPSCCKLLHFSALLKTMELSTLC